MEGGCTLDVGPDRLGRDDQRRPPVAGIGLASYQPSPFEPSGLRLGDWKGVQPEKGKSWELYDLKTDLAESKNVATENPGIVSAIAARADAARTEFRPYPAPTHQPGFADFVR